MIGTDNKDQQQGRVETAYLVGCKSANNSVDNSKEHLDELKELVNTMGLKTVGTEIANVRLPNSRYYIGSGKVEEITDAAKRFDADCIIVDFELSPSQQRNWEKLSNLCVIDRQEVILDIFADRATTREAVIQVALARMEYSLPRLKRAWTHLSRQRGGNKGTRGEGEKQLEADRRLVQNRITQLKKDLKEVSKHREVQRAKREKQSTPIAAIIGYTNVGKSSLLNALSGANAFVENKLFATLDPTTRIVNFPNNQNLLVTDTVGLIRKLPHNLVEAFKSTLEAALVADFIIHVLDISNPSVEDHWKTTLKLLDELNALDKPSIIVFNKMDKLESPVVKARMNALYKNSVFISVKTGEGIDTLKSKLIEQINKDSDLMQLCIPVDKHDISSKVYRVGKVINAKYEDNNTLIYARIPKKYQSNFQEYSTRNR
ncbi:MAG TPA: GTPase HflX [Victivallales bacterium]|nr:GTPase HflX [Victivallales bacterium]